MPHTLGPFALVTPLAKGGMGQVWRAVHQPSGQVAAVKVTANPGALTDEFVRRFRDEVRAVARLDHPNIAVILDHGEVTAAEAAAGWPVGAPWLAMELASGGTLAEHRPGTWPEIQSALLAILDALAHAHARGVIHRDLKPGNILHAGPGDIRPGYKLVDFGIAYAGADPDQTGPIDELVVGTPQYMSPEQIRGEWRDYGPWTDLYALGCLGWWLLTGATPFGGKAAHQTLVGHLLNPIPDFQPRMAVPLGVEGWLVRLLQKPTADRYARAADAADALRALPASSDRRVFPRTWRRAEPPAPPLALVGAGIRLHGLREVPLVGREAERDALWEALGAVAASGRARLVVLRGPAGIGKSRLVEWLTERAHEAGAASWCKASFTQNQAPGEALRRMGTHWLRTQGMTRPEVRSRVVRFLAEHGCADADEAEVLTELLSPAGTDEQSGPRVRLTRFSEFYAGTRNTMVRLASNRPLIAWFDDVQWGLHGLGLASQILKTQDERPFPVLVVLTVREEGLQPGSLEAERLARLLEAPESRSIRLEALPRAAALALGAGLGLSAGFAARVAERAAGNPLFAVQLVTDQLARGGLVVGHDGLHTAPGIHAELPDDLHAVWSGHLGRLLAEFSPQAAHCLEIAAVLGSPVDRKEWRRACDDPDGHFGDRFPGDESLRAQLVDRLLVAGLVTGGRDGWHFVHGMLRESLVRTAREGGRLAAHHAACAAMLGGRGADPLVAERRGVHLLGAGLPELALAPLVRGVEIRLAAIGPLPALSLLDTAAEAAGHLPARDPRLLSFLLISARVRAAVGELDAALALAADARGRAATWGWPEAWRALLVEAEVLGRSRRPNEARAAYQALAATGDARAAAHADLGLGRFEAALAAFDRVGDAQGAAAAATGFARATTGEVARDAWHSALVRWERLGYAGGSAEAIEQLARLDHAAGAAEAAEAGFWRAIVRYDAVGSTDRATGVRLALAALLAAGGRLDEVPPLVAPATARAGDDPAASAALVAAGRWVGAALRGDLLGWDGGFEAVVTVLPNTRDARAAAAVAGLAGVAAACLPPAETGRRERVEAAMAMVRQMIRG